MVVNQNHSDMIQILWYNVKKSIENNNDQGYTVDSIQFDSMNKRIDVESQFNIPFSLLNNILGSL